MSQAKIRGDAKLTFFIISFYYVQLINSSIKVMLPLSAAMWSRLSVFGAVILCLILAYSLPVIFARATKALVCGELIFLNIVLVGLMMGYADTDTLKATAFRTLCVCYPFAVCVFCIDDYGCLLKRMYTSAYVLIVIAVTTLIVSVGMESKQDYGYNMSISYFLLLPLLLILHRYFERRKVIDLLFLIVSILCIVLFGARGPLLCILALFIEELFRNRDSVSPFKAGVLLIILVLFAANWKTISTDILLWASSHGHKSRTLYLLFNHSFSHLSGRDAIYSVTLSRIAEKPIWGWGFVGGWISSSEYPHSILLELPLCFGWPIGIVLDILFLVILINGFIKAKTAQGELACIFSAAVIQLLVSGTFWTSPEFFALVLLFIKMLRSRTDAVLKSESYDKVEKSCLI